MQVMPLIVMLLINGQLIPSMHLKIAASVVVALPVVVMAANRTETMMVAMRKLLENVKIYQEKVVTDMATIAQLMKRRICVLKLIILQMILLAGMQT